MTASTACTRIRVDLGHRSYDVTVGHDVLAEVGKTVTALGGARAAIVTDSNVSRWHLARLEACLTASGSLRGTVTVPAGEKSKSFDRLATASAELLELGVERGDVVIALGGGVVGDLAGFAAAILRRGVRFVQVPTSLLACVDSSVGGKTGINVPAGKNLIGAFHQPIAVVADLAMLETLPLREMRAGYAEIVKCALLGDAAFFRWLEQNGEHVIARERDCLQYAVCRSIEMKARIVTEDEHETGRRALLNLGHTFGHALEAFTGYSDRLLHGEAVAIGLTLAAQFSEHLGRCPIGLAARVGQHLEAIGLPSRIDDVAGGRPTAQDLVALMMQDKKVRSGKLAFILLTDIGDAALVRDVPNAVVVEFLTRTLENNRT